MKDSPQHSYAVDLFGLRHCANISGYLRLGERVLDVCSEPSFASVNKIAQISENSLSWLIYSIRLSTDVSNLWTSFVRNAVSYNLANTGCQNHTTDIQHPQTQEREIATTNAPKVQNKRFKRWHHWVGVCCKPCFLGQNAGSLQHTPTQGLTTRLSAYPHPHTAMLTEESETSLFVWTHRVHPQEQSGT